MRLVFLKILVRAIKPGNIITEKQKEIQDTIHYARRIQMAQIPNENETFYLKTQFEKLKLLKI
ncbi:MAG: hypothetical protein IPM51_13875 [Sphingobacteriaceae bacterium]|nr:hypothetical protein [Sphingobacteriaceae bacterium]